MHTSLLEIGTLLKKGSLSPVDLTRDCLARIERLNPILNAFITITADSAMAEARQAEIEIQQGNWRGPLHGVPLAIKDLIDTAGVRTTAASALFQDRIPTEDAEVIRRLKQAGAIFLGKLNLHEFAYGGSSMVSYYGEVHNPWNPAHIAGGSSGGSATAVAAEMCWGSIGTDTSGSIREPAALCGIVGLKPTYGRVSAHGVIPLSWSLDHVGPIARTVSDAAVILQATAGYDQKDPASANVPVDDYVGALSSPVRAPLRIGVPRRYFFEELHPEIAAAVEHALDVLRNFAKDVRDVELAIPMDRTLQSAEAYAYHREWIASAPELYQPETLRRLRTGEKLDASEKLRQDLDKIRQEVDRVFEQVDFLITPTTPVPAPPIAELKDHPDHLRPRELVLLRNTRPDNVWGLPSISVPCGFTSEGLPIGLQITGRRWSESAVLQFAYAYEQTTAWHKRQPPTL